MSVNVEALYKKYGPMVYRRCLSLLKDNELAADTAQDVFLHVLTRRHVLRDEYPCSLLYRIATNVSINALRKRKRSRVTGDPDLLEAIASDTDVAGLVVAKNMLDVLFARESTDPERVSSKTLAVLRFVDGLTLEETAEVAGMSVSGVRKRLRSLKEKSRILFPEDGV